MRRGYFRFFIFLLAAFIAAIAGAILTDDWSLKRFVFSFILGMTIIIILTNEKTKNLIFPSGEKADNKH